MAARTTVAAVLVPATRGHYERLLSLVAEVRADAPDAVHRMRVATRRLRSLLGTFSDAFPPAATVTVRAELRWLGGVLGAARDAEVLAERFGDLIDAQPTDLLLGSVHQRLVGTQEDLYRAAHARVVDVLDGPRFAALCALLDEVTSGGHAVPTETTVRGGLDAAYRKLERARRTARKTTRRTASDSSGADAAWHRVRKRAKRLRYAAETVAARDASAAALAAAAESVQTLLGERQDGVLARARILDAARQARDDDEDTFAYGVLYAVEREHADRAPDELADRLRSVRKAYRGLDFRG
ncbi:CHAD domain-containing protein [Prescottella sp. R16]|uniref:CHAD domain-containing protein n=1 Tax=Prescottella sp. R16 TaxID=3064529 RepID=UPI00272E5733|nr:CHAD domain-containing protein [Prescottella sp. R16]